MESVKIFKSLVVGLSVTFSLLTVSLLLTYWPERVLIEFIGLIKEDYINWIPFVLMISGFSGLDYLFSRGK